MFNPVATYRLQFHKDFTFKNLKDIIPYLHQLGVKTIYASPIFAATPGSTHGYDVTNPLEINPEIGTLPELREISKQLRKLGMSWLQDIVPNHMAFHPDNHWLMDVLEKGRKSAYADFFDIEWDSPVYDGRVMVPFLGSSFDEAVEQCQIKVTSKDDKLWLSYFDQHYPVNTDADIEKVNQDPQLLKTLAKTQFYQLCHWQETDRQINYRRFFTVNGLICLNMQYREVFTAYHKFIKQLLDEDIFQGLRVDHIDGLYDPKGYLQQLRELSGPDTYITVEKILESGEDFPADWPVQGNTGYDFLGQVNNLLTDASSEKQFTSFYEKLSGDKQPIEESIEDKKDYILRKHFAGELENLYRLFVRINLDVNDESIKEAIAQLLIHCPVYRYYERDKLSPVFDVLIKLKPKLKAALNTLRKVIIDTESDDALHFFKRCMQFSGPLMAKGVEDTLMYTYNRFIGHNEVGDSPASFGLSTDAFHRSMSARQQHSPLTINGTSTHDTKRGEDVRARLNALTALPDEWLKLIRKLQLPTDIDANDLYFIYQSLIGAHPMPDGKGADFESRLQEYLIKALREGKRKSDWAEPNEAYESNVQQYISRRLGSKSVFYKKFAAFQRRIADLGIINSLAQVLLKFTCPGIPDVYQGCEQWDLSLVDPDNRRPVDYNLRLQLLDAAANWPELWEDRYSGRVKLKLTQRLLQLRSAAGETFSNGDYLPLETSGKFAANILAFARQYGGEWYITAVPLHFAAIGGNGAEPTAFDWKDTAIQMPAGAPVSWQSVLTDTKGQTEGSVFINTLFQQLPIALIKLQKSTNRGAGLLLHITSLPSAFGMGDIGPEAHRFIDFLADSGQRYWQMLPVNPVDIGAGYSPYSATSSLAGDPFLISPELLVNDGWLDEKETQEAIVPGSHRADFDKATAVKRQLLTKAYENFVHIADKTAFEDFKESEKDWLNDFALYQVIKQWNGGKPWYQWTKDIRDRKTTSLNKVANEHTAVIDKEKWQQYIFSRQWRLLKEYAERKGIVLFGDMPFYISYDSVDVWSQPHYFKLDRQKNIAGIAGVPPDYFSAEGQLWGMPVFNWEKLKSDNYKWWLQRIRKNLEYVDLIRLDHFRAFAAYWEVPGGEKTAINGQWMQGPGSDFFDVVQKDIGELPFVAEDLGDIDQSVHDLRDKFGLPGMKVLQFAFGNDMPQSDHIPHCYKIDSFVYTGTHDNNTTKGWYQDDADKTTKNRLNSYTGIRVSKTNVPAIMSRLAYASIGKVVIVPVQDLLGLDAEHRMNVPASAAGNWTWRLKLGQLDSTLAARLKKLMFLYGR